MTRQWQSLIGLVVFGVVLTIVAIVDIAIQRRRDAREFASSDLDDDVWLLRMYDIVDRLLRSGKFAIVDALLRNADVSQMPTLRVLGLACITLSATHLLPSRELFMIRARRRLAQLEPGRADELLAGLE